MLFDYLKISVDQFCLQLIVYVTGSALLLYYIVTHIIESYRTIARIKTSINARKCQINSFFPVIHK